MSAHESPSYRAAMIDSGRGHLLPDPHVGPARVVMVPAERLAVDLAVHHAETSLTLDCFRGLSDADCEVRCCRACDRAERVPDHDLCFECWGDVMEMRAGVDAPGTRCTSGCGFCGRCGGR